MSNVPNPPPSESPPSPAPTPAARRWLRWTVEIALILALIAGVRAWQQSGTVRGPAPALAGVLLDGGAYTLAPAAGQPVLVHFWATWCPICRAEQSSIETLARDYPIVTVAMQSGDDAEVARYLRAESLSFPVLNDPDGAIATHWGVRGVPASFVVDGAGQIRFVEVGYTTSVGLRLRLWLARVWT
ncbi:MAG: protein disulfide oxidoreductase [Gammaproteobacteria bacterium]|nr:protein disulfide oxidoreductase [Gammaproteobacteria bacterium]